MDNIKVGIWGWKQVEGGGCVSLDLGPLTLYAGVSPAMDIRVYARPKEPRGEKFLGGSDTWV